MISDLITDEYRELNRELHERVPQYGCGDHAWAPFVLRLCSWLGPDSILNYGAGKGTFKRRLGTYIDTPVREYDPAVDGISDIPYPADIVVCLDVLEHVEREKVSGVLRHLKHLTQKVLLVDISCKVGQKKLADGRPAHILVRPPHWWEEKLSSIGRVERLEASPDSYVALVWKD